MAVATVDQAAPAGPATAAGPAGRRRRRLPVGWPILSILVIFPLWYALGLGGFIWIIMGVPMIVNLVMRKRQRVPRGFIIWLFFLGWVLFSVFEVTRATSYLTYAYRLFSYVAATAAFLHVVNTDEEELSTDRLINALAVFWIVIVVGGFAAMVAPAFSFPTPTGKLLGGLGNNPLLVALVHPRLAQAQQLGGVKAIGHAIARPAAPFAYTNWWGANYAILVPFVVIAWRRARSRRIRWALAGAMAASLVPFVYSINRGAWLSLIVAGLYAWTRFAIRTRGRALVGGLAVLAVVAVLAVATPLSGVISARLGHSGSASLRLELYQQSGQSVMASPVLGYGVPLPQPVSKYSLPNVGTQGQIWLVLVSVGIPGTVFFLLWLLYVFWKSRSADDPVTFAVHLVILMGFIQMPFYGWMPVEMFLIMALAGLVWRRRSSLSPGARPLPVPAPGALAARPG